MTNKDQLLKETIVMLSADLYEFIYDRAECWTEAASEIIRLATQFENELDWQDDDERDYLHELEKFEQKVMGRYKSLDSEPSSTATETRRKYENFIRENGFEPKYATCSVVFKEDNAVLDAIFQLAYDEDEDDTFIFFQCNGLSELISLFDKNNGEDFYINKVNSFCE